MNELESNKDNKTLKDISLTNSKKGNNGIQKKRNLIDKILSSILKQEVK